MTDAVELERLLPGPIELVWDHLTRPELRAAWLPETGEITRCEAPAMLEFAWNGGTSVRVELEPRGESVLLRLTHRRLRPALVGACAVLIAAMLAFQGSSPAPESPRPQLGPEQVSLKFHSSVPQRLYGMLGGRC
jgi:hypothetical protein